LGFHEIYKYRGCFPMAPSLSTIFPLLLSFSLFLSSSVASCRHLSYFIWIAFNWFIFVSTLFLLCTVCICLFRHTSNNNPIVQIAIQSTNSMKFSWLIQPFNLALHLGILFSLILALNNLKILCAICLFIYDSRLLIVRIFLNNKTNWEHTRELREFTRLFYYK